MPKARNQRPTNVDYYRRNREREHARIRVRQIGQLELLRDLRRVPCKDCGLTFEPYQMDFDHRDSATKSFNLMTGRVLLMATAKVLAEVAKCDIVCANCHRVRSQLQATRRWENGHFGHSARIEEKRRYWRAQANALIDMRAVPCMDCRGSFSPYAMEFDHRDPDTKTQQVMAMVGRAGMRRILEEVAKCDVVCANCHRMRTFQRRESATTERE